MDAWLNAKSLYLSSGILLGSATVFGPFLVNFLQAVATAKGWRANESELAKGRGSLVRSFHLAAILSSAIFAVRWITQGFIGTSGVPSMVEYMASDIALSIIELWITFAAYHSLKSAYLISRSDFPDKCLWSLVQFQILQLMVCDSICYLGGSQSNKAMYYIFKDGAHVVNFAGNLIVIVGASCHLRRKLEAEPMLMVMVEERKTVSNLHRKLRKHFRMIWIITAGTIVGIGFYIFFLVFRDYQGPFINAEDLDDRTIYVTIAINAAEFICLTLASIEYWIPIKPFLEQSFFMSDSLIRTEDASINNSPYVAVTPD